MPIYEYRCPCGAEQEVLAKVEDPAPSHCGKTMLRKVSKPGGLFFHGSGFYATDYGSQPDGLSVLGQQIRAKREILNSGGFLPKIPQVKEDATSRHNDHSSVK